MCCVYEGVNASMNPRMSYLNRVVNTEVGYILFTVIQSVRLAYFTK